MSPPVRKAIRKSTSSPSRNKRRKPRKKSPGNRAFFMWAPKEGGGLTLRAANAHSSTERGRFYILSAPWTSEKHGGNRNSSWSSGGTRRRALRWSSAPESGTREAQTPFAALRGPEGYSSLRIPG